MSESRKTLEEELARLRDRVGEIEALLGRGAPQTALAGDAPPAGAGDAPSVEAPLAEVPPPLTDIFKSSQPLVSGYFQHWDKEPQLGRFAISGERYILVRAASMSTEFFELVRSLYRDRGEEEARSVAFGVLYDVAHALGKADAVRFRERMEVKDPLELLVAGLTHFALAGWARVVIHPESRISADEHCFLYYDHDHSFEAEAWGARRAKADFPVCAMSAGYSSGWCEESFGMPLVGVEIACRARGDPHCRFVMAPPFAVNAHLERLAAEGQPVYSSPGSLEVPEFFRRKRLEDQLREARDQLEQRVAERTEEVNQRNEQLRRANERLAASYRAREEFLAMISHELRTPLVTGLGYIELLLAGRLGPLGSEAAAGMKVALRNLQRLTGLVEDILRYQQLVQPVGPAPALLPTDVGTLCAECVEELLVRTGRAEGSVGVDVQDGLPLVLGDSDMLRQVLGNLLDNAQRHAGEEVPIRVAASLEGERTVRVSVEDSGPGVPPELLGRLTEPFVRSGRRKPGLGLGLAIVEQLLRAHGTFLDVRSEAGLGASFSFRLSRAPLESQASLSQGGRRRKHSTGGLGGDGLHVLLVEDDQDTAEFVALALRQEGCRVTVVATGEEALVALDRPAVDLVLVDQGLPGMLGTELCATLRERWPEGSLYIYLFTAHADETTRHKCEESGCDGLLVKPVAVRALRDLARAIRRMRREAEASVPEPSRRSDMERPDPHPAAIMDALKRKGPETRIAVVGASNDPEKYGNIIVRNLHGKGYTVLPINPKAETVAGLRAYPDLEAALAGGPIHIVNFVTPPSVTKKVLEEVEALGLPNVWLQDGSFDEAVLDSVAKASYRAYYNGCIMVVSNY
ncbi:MAG: CoA-binding protein [Polyangia bacterium]|nr:CoA-binding protein [Polyangia bacterium]